MFHLLDGSNGHPKVPLSLSQRISSAPAPWCRIITWTLNMCSGLSSRPVPSHLSQVRSGSTSCREWQSILTSSSQGSSPLLQRIGPPHPSETLISPSGKASHPNSISLMVTGPSPGMPLSPPSSVLSPTEPWNCEFIPNTSFNCFGALPLLQSKVINLDKAIRRYVGEVKHIELADVAQFRHLEACYLQDDGAGNQASPRKEKGSSRLNRRSNKVCRQWNSGACNRCASECRFHHLCSKC